jgi:UTP--glucose-1-phosphate uridylyltransferase
MPFFERPPSPFTRRAYHHPADDASRSYSLPLFFYFAMTDRSHTLQEELDRLAEDLRTRLDAAGFDRQLLLALAATLRGDAVARRDARNRISGEVATPREDEILAAPTWGTPESGTLAALGDAAIARGEVALAVLAGGMATRMGGVVKALVPALGRTTFLDLRLAENASTSARAKRPVPLWLMTSDATDASIRRHLEAVGAPSHVRTFVQGLGLRLSPNGLLFRGNDGQPSPYATGHGDLVVAVRRSGLLRSFRKGGGKYVWIANLDNLGATVDPAVLGTFIASNSDVMVEVCEKDAGDRGGIPVHAEGRLQVLEEFRLPHGFDASKVRVFNTNTFLVRADALETAEIEWNWFEVEKEVDGRPAIQFERLLQELTHALAATYLKVPRHGTSSRFLPVKDNDELGRRRTEIEAIARTRGMISR